jgi:2-octaprenyl-6-methoxyphenol hydroxylase
MKHDADILIAGGGLNGPALALALAQGGLSVTVIDARPAPARAEAGFDGRAYALAIASKRLLSVIGIWPGGRRQGAADPADRRLGRKGGRRGGAVLPGLRFGRDRGRPDGLHAGGPAPLRRLPGRDAAPSLRLLSGETVVAQEAGPAGVTVTLASARQLAARLLVGCDGRGSGVAARAGIRRAGLGLWPDRAGDRDPAREGPPGHRAPVLHAPGPLAILPLAGGHHSSHRLERDRRRRRRHPGAGRRRLSGGAAPALRRFPGGDFAWPERGSPIRCRCRWPNASSRRGWRWSAMRRMACIRLPGRA